MFRSLLLCIMAAAGIAMGGCSIPTRGPAVPVADVDQALPLGLANVRFYADGDPQAMLELGQRALEREKAALPPGTRLRRPISWLSRAAATTAHSAPAC